MNMDLLLTSILVTRKFLFVRILVLCWVWVADIVLWALCFITGCYWCCICFAHTHIHTLRGTIEAVPHFENIIYSWFWLNWICFLLINPVSVWLGLDSRFWFMFGLDHIFSSVIRSWLSYAGFYFWKWVLFRFSQNSGSGFCSGWLLWFWLNLPKLRTRMFQGP